ncbi:hypothetical protein [Lederbergia galactosidilytica]|nr:hypothetical protein [Lederbergia galactosidilytica]MBP1916760.1 hypothetical protein [Lederbergia galactosidilytica]
MNLDIIKRLNAIQDESHFSGTVLVQQNNEALAQTSYGFANRSEQIEN